MARQSEALKSALLASLGHDPRAPLTAIRVAPATVRAPGLGEDDRGAGAERIVVSTEVERLTRLFEDILDMARIDAGRRLDRAALGTRRRRLSTPRREQVERTVSRRRIETAIRDDTLVRLDPRLTAAALAHLLENAARYSPAGSVITVGTRMSADTLTIEVRDRGPGIPAADLPHLFERFYRGTQARAVSGTGMGLSIARGLLAVERGRIWADNCAGGGASSRLPSRWTERAIERPA